MQSIQHAIFIFIFIILTGCHSLSCEYQPICRQTYINKHGCGAFIIDRCSFICDSCTFNESACTTCWECINFEVKGANYCCNNPSM